MDPQPPIDQDTIPLFKGNIERLKARLKVFREARATLRKWTLPIYQRKNLFPIYESQMLLLFHDAEVYDVVMGRALRPVPVVGEANIQEIKRELYDEVNFQAYSLIYRTFTADNSGIVDASGAPINDGHFLWSS